MTMTMMPAPLPSEPSQQHQRTNLEYTDHGEASSNTYIDLQRVVHLITQERHLIAYSLYKSTLVRIQQQTHTNHQQAEIFLQNHQREFYKLEQQARIFHRAKQNAIADPNSPWIQCHVHQNVTSSYRREEDGSLSLKVEGDIAGLPLFEQVSVMREVDLYHNWAPFVSKSSKLAQLGKMDQVGWFEVSPPLAFGLVRDACYRAIGCDCMMESGEVIVVAEGLEDDDGDGDEKNTHENEEREHSQYLNEEEGEIIQNFVSDEDEDYYNNNAHDNNEEGDDEGHINDEQNEIPTEEFINNFLARESIMNSIQLPPRPKGMNKNRMQLKFFQAIIKVTSPTSANTLLVANIDPKINFLPQFAIDFIMKHMCGLLLVKMQNAAKKALVNHRNDPLAIRMRDDNFYKSWLLPKFESYAREMGWDLPEVNAFKGMEEYDNSISRRREEESRSRNRNRAVMIGPVGGEGGDLSRALAGGTRTSIHPDDDTKDNASRSSRRRRLKLKFRRKKPKSRSDTGTTTGHSHTEDVSRTSRTSQFSRLKLKLGRKKKPRSTTSGQSAPEFQSNASTVTATSRVPKVQFSPERLKRLGALKRFKDELGDEPPAMKGLYVALVQSVVKGGETGVISHAMNDVSHLFVLPMLFLVMFFVLHGISHGGFLLDHHSLIRNIATVAGFVLVFLCVHWAVVETILVSMFDAIDLPVIKFTGEHKSSSTRQYVINQIHLYSKIYSGALGILVISKRVTVGSFRGLIWLFRRAITPGQVEDLAADIFSTSCHQIIEDAKSIMTYSAVFVAICCLIAVVSFPSKEETPVKTQRRKATAAPTIDISMLRTGTVSPTSTSTGRTSTPKSNGKLLSIPESPPSIPKRPMAW